MSTQYFGDIDAAKEDCKLLSDYFIVQPLFERVEKEKNDGPTIVVGVKGAGKTALGRVVYERFNGLKWFRDEFTRSYGFDVPENLPPSGKLLKSLRVFLLSQFITALVRNGDIKKDIWTKFKASLKHIGAKVAKSTEVNVGVMKFDPAKLLDVSNEEHSDDAWEDSIKLLNEELGGKSGLMVIDDVDSYFPGIESSPRFIEGLFRAIREINDLKELKIFCLLLVKQGLWRSLFENQEEYDKVKKSVDFLSWNIDNCAAVLSGRIAQRHNMDFEKKPQKLANTTKYLKREFSGVTANETQTCFMRVFELSVNGPRDVIDLCNLVKKTYPDEKISISNIDNCLPKYSEEKLYGINQDFGHIYPDLPKFLSRAFSGFKTEFKGSELAAHLEDKDGILIDPKAEHLAFGKHSWFKDTTAEGIVKILFDTGVIGVVRKDGPAVFSNEDNSLSQNSLIGSHLIVHNAYRHALGLQ
jgi:hypothetical protein